MSESSAPRTSGISAGSDEPPSPPLPFRLVEQPAEFCDAALQVVRLPRGIRSKAKLLAILADKLRFPGYFGHNWDALEECLRDLSWLDGERPIALVHPDLPFGNGSDHRLTYLDILASAAQANPRLVVVLPK
jgi:RNAse (barnase) inhibitor barstar